VRVVLVHGLGRTPLSMMFLARSLSRAGHRPEYFAYFPYLETHDRILTRLVRRLRIVSELGEEVGLVGHSYGGLLLREAVAALPDLKVAHLVMLGTPNQPPRLAARVYRSLPFRILRGTCGRNLTDPLYFRTLPKLRSPYTIVAGTAGWRGRLSPFRMEPNDGLVAVSETLVEDKDRPVLLPVMHTFLTTNKTVRQVVIERLQG
jgi:pimeloyl-ACP methyl ester carboxylesterase